MKSFKELREMQNSLNLGLLSKNPIKKPKKPRKQPVNWYPDGSNNKNESFDLAESASALEAKKFELTHHVTNTIPDTENITKIHDMIHEIQKLGGSADAEYDKIANNPLVPQPYRNCCSCD